MSADKPVHLAFVGSGNWAHRYHFPALAHIQSTQLGSLSLRGIFSLDHDTVCGVADRYGFERAYRSVGELIADEEIDALAIAVPPDALVDVIEQLLPMGKPILSEKPPGISFQQAEYLAQIVSVPNVVAFNRRFVPLNNQFKTIVDAMDCPFYVEGHFFRHDRHDPDFVLATGIHWINYLEFLFGEIRSVRNTRFAHPNNATLVRVAEIVFGNGLHGLIKFFPCTGSQGERVEVHSENQSAFLFAPLWADRGEIVIESATRNEELHQQRPRLERIAGSMEDPEVVTFGIVGEYIELLTIVTNAAESRSTFQNVVNAMRVAEAIEIGTDIL